MGLQTKLNGDEYNGQFKNGEAEGHGVWKSGRRRGVMYDGNFKAGGLFTAHAHPGFNGQGKMTFSDGAVYQGQWEDGDRHGYGVVTRKPAARPVPRVTRDPTGQLLPGFGAPALPTNSSEDSSGDGRHYKSTLSDSELRYSGNWNRDDRHGEGIYTTVCRSRFKAQWVNGALVPGSKRFINFGRSKAR